MKEDKQDVNMKFSAEAPEIATTFYGGARILTKADRKIQITITTTTHLSGLSEFRAPATPELAWVWSSKDSHSLLVGVQKRAATLETVWQFLTKLNILFPYNPAIILLDTYPKEMKNVHTKPCRWTM